MQSEKQSDNKLSLTLFWTKVDADDASNRSYQCKLTLDILTLWIISMRSLPNGRRCLRERGQKIRERCNVDTFLQPQVDSKYKNIFRWL